MPLVLDRQLPVYDLRGYPSSSNAGGTDSLMQPGSDRQQLSVHRDLSGYPSSSNPGGTSPLMQPGFDRPLSVHHDMSGHPGSSNAGSTSSLMQSGFDRQHLSAHHVDLRGYPSSSTAAGTTSSLMPLVLDRQLPVYDLRGYPSSSNAGGTGSLMQPGSDRSHQLLSPHPHYGSTVFQHTAMQPPSFTALQQLMYANPHCNNDVVQSAMMPPGFSPTQFLSSYPNYLPPPLYQAPPARQLPFAAAEKEGSFFAALRAAKLLDGDDNHILEAVFAKAAGSREIGLDVMLKQEENVAARLRALNPGDVRVGLLDQWYAFCDMHNEKVRSIYLH